MIHFLRRFFIAAVSVCVAQIQMAQAAPFDSGRAAFTIGVKGVTSDLSILSVTAMPGERLSIQTTASGHSESGPLSRGGDAKTLTWKAPMAPGLSTLTFINNGEKITLNVFVLTPWKNGEQANLNGYKIGAYSKTPFRGLASYAAPTGFIEADASLRNVRVSPHFTLGQFKCKQQPGVEPAYLLVHPGTLLKLERLLAAANERGWRVDTLHVMSGFRTPFYNRAIGNTTTSSRHLFGGAADVFIDANGDNWMDDLNGDGVVNKKDASLLADLAESLAKSDPSAWPAGGLAVYAENSIRGPFVHVDVRGYRARWGR